MGFFSNLDQDSYDRQYSDSYLFQRIWSYFKQQRRPLSLTVIASLAFSIFFAFGPLLIAAGIDALENQNVNKILLVVGALLLTALGQYAASFIQRFQSARLVAEVTAVLRKDSLAAAVARDMAFYDENKSGKVLSRITSDTEEFGQVVLFSTQIINQLVQAFILLGVLIFRNVPMTLLLLAFIPFLAVATYILRNLARSATRQGSRAMAAVNDNIQESVSGIGVAKNFRQEGMIYTEFVAVNEQSYSINLKKGMVLSLVFPVLNALTGLATATVLYFGAVTVIGGAITISLWYLYIQAVDRFWFPIINISAFWSQFQAGMSAIERIFALIDADNTVQQTDDKPAPVLKGQITFDAVKFSYTEDQTILADFDLHIAPGENIAFVGHTGAGKSSIVKLLTRFYEFQGGRILVDGHDIRTFNLQSYRRQLGLVPQMPFLFRGTIADNIRYARPDAKDDEIMHMATSIGSGDWLETLPDGLASEVGERGGRLSMGQRQLVALLRILIQKPAIFILDEATASIDPFTEAQIQEALDLILKQSTSIMIAHRLSTVRSADRIIVLRSGEIIEVGDHDALIAQGGHYAELYNTYFRHQSLNYIENARAMFDSEAAR